MQQKTVLISCLALFAGHFLSADTSGDFEYEVVDGAAVITGYNASSTVVIDIPAEFDGIPVTAIAADAFEDVPARLGLKIPASVVEIEPGALSAMGELLEIIVSEDNPAYASLDGVLFDKDMATLIQFPNYFGGRLPSRFGYEYMVPESVQYIADRAFFECIGLTVITLPAVLEEIGNEAFSGCYKLSALDLPDGLVRIGDEAFAICEGLLSISLPASLEFLGAGAFRNCRQLGDITVDPGNSHLTSADGAVYDKDLTRLIQFSPARSGTFTVPASIQEIGPMAFAGSNGLNQVILPDGLKTIGHTAFYKCESLQAISIPPGVTEIPDYAFAQCTILNQVILPEGLLNIGNRAFYLCRYLTDLTFPPSMESIGDYAFFNCLELSELALPDGLESIGHNAFRGCVKLPNQTIPKSMTFVGFGAFSYCLSMDAITVDPENPNYTSIDGVLYDKAVRELMLFPIGKLEPPDIPDSVEVIQVYSFDGFEFKYLIIPSSVTELRTNFLFGNTWMELIFEGPPPVFGPTQLGEVMHVYYIEGTPGWEDVGQYGQAPTSPIKSEYLPYEEDGRSFADLDPWLGRLMVDLNPWIYSEKVGEWFNIWRYRLLAGPRWIHLPGLSLDSPTMSFVVVRGTDWAWSTTLQRWAYLPQELMESGWLYVIPEGS